MFKVVAPKKARLAEAEESLAETMKILNAKREELAEVEGKLANLKLTFAEMTDKKQQLEFQVWLVLSISLSLVMAQKICWILKSVQKPFRVCIGFHV